MSKYELEKPLMLQPVPDAKFSGSVPYAWTGISDFRSTPENFTASGRFMALRKPG
jgi:hypothetical protein